LKGLFGKDHFGQLAYIQYQMEEHNGIQQEMQAPNYVPIKNDESNIDIID
jgi:hypothetical protein